MAESPPWLKFLSAPGPFNLKSLLLALYDGDILSAKRFHRRLSYLLPLYSYYYGHDRSHVTKRIQIYSAYVIQLQPCCTQSLDYLRGFLLCKKPPSDQCPNTILCTSKNTIDVGFLAHAPIAKTARNHALKS